MNNTDLIYFVGAKRYKSKVSFHPGFKVKIGDLLIVETTRGIEYAYAGLNLCACKNRRQQRNKVTIKKILRIATEEDLRSLQRMVADQRKYKKHARLLIEKLELPIRIRDLELIFDRSQIYFYYQKMESKKQKKSFKLNDFTNKFSFEMHCKAEMREVGDRGLAKVLNGIGNCGLPFCCSGFLDRTKTISVKLAKSQNLVLNMHKLSGQCGKLKCCLDYEKENYIDGKLDIKKNTENLYEENADFFKI
ncbi:hypothetical protein HOC37_03700 [bacterium]|nr:hypothetical protein [bacterium]MBT4552074.1 hypothetical protein [bacterium]MBT5989135.1 hypothetical protein [bacterium]